jgi:prepilin signal peptidase PulO-like enzyme (type II secretory pathway)
MMDLKYGVLADEIVFPLIAISLIILIYQYMIISFFPIIIVQSFLIAALVSAFFFILAIITKGKGMGGGDIKLSFLMGLVLGLPGIIIALYLAFISGGLVASVLLLLRKKHFGQTIPFGPFLALATIVTIFYGDQIWLWYTRKFLGG